MHCNQSEHVVGTFWKLGQTEEENIHALNYAGATYLLDAVKMSPAVNETVMKDKKLPRKISPLPLQPIYSNLLSTSSQESEQIKNIFLSFFPVFYIPSSSSLPLQLKHKNREYWEGAAKKSHWSNWPAMPINTTTGAGFTKKPYGGKTFTITSVWKNKLLVVSLVLFLMASGLLGTGTSFWKILGALVEAGGGGAWGGGATVSLKMRLSYRPQ